MIYLQLQLQLMNTIWLLIEHLKNQHLVNDKLDVTICHGKHPFCDLNNIVCFAACTFVTVDVAVAEEVVVE